MDEKLMAKINEVFQETGSLERTAKKMGFAYAKVRKALVTTGVYSTRFSEEVLKLRLKGYSVIEIANALGTSANRVSAWLPYEKNMYNLSEKTLDAKRCDNYRTRIGIARKNLVLKKYAGSEKETDSMNNPETIEKSPLKVKPPTTQGEPVRLHLKLSKDYLEEEDRQILKNFGRSSTGDSIERDILIPNDITLHAHHYAIQRLFGWQNSHLHSYKLPDEVHRKLTCNTVRGWGGLIGVLFQTVYPADVWHERYSDDDYKSGSVKTWLRTKYTGPYDYIGYFHMLDILNSPDDPDEMDETETKVYTGRWAHSMGWSTRKVANKNML